MSTITTNRNEVQVSQLEVRMKPFHLDIEEHFQCSICLDLAFKPIVQSCGHIFCFWCVHKAMNKKMESQCPTCRRPYLHFPRVCTLLHDFFMKTFTEQYTSRAYEIQEMEKRYQVFSPNTTMHPRNKSSLISLEHNVCYDYSSTSSPSTPSTPITPIDYKPNHKPLSILKNDTTCYDYSSTSSPSTPSTPITPIDYKPNHEPLSILKNDITHLAEPNSKPNTSPTQPIEKASCPLLNVQDFRILNLDTSITTKEMDVKCNDNKHNLPLVEDFQCAKCEKFLYKPVVLNCGEVFCQSCLKTSSAELSPINCPSCKAPHPGACLSICLELEQYLKAMFPLQYEQRKMEVSTCNDECTNLNYNYEANNFIGGNFNKGEYHLVHEGVGCDGCGMFPIIGRRYRCKDCHECIGFDLCEKCKNTNTFYGRFNQQHTNQHEMEEVTMLKSGGIVHARLRQTNQIVPLTLSLNSNAIVQRRVTQNQYFQEFIFNDLDDYIDCLV